MPDSNDSREGGGLALANIRVVLVRPKRSGNIGSVARAMKNSGVSDLALVSPRPVRRFPARAMAVHARDVLESMQVFPDLAEAVADCGRVYGTTCRAGSYRRRLETPRSAAPVIVDTAARNRVAIVFGPEDTGLENDDLRICHELLTIPTHGDYRSLNLAQAALICLHEIFLSAHPPVSEARELATSADLERMYGRLQGVLLRIGFLHDQNPDHILFSLRRMFGRAALEDRDVRIWLGIARQIEWFASGGREVAEEKARRGERLK